MDKWKIAIEINLAKVVAVAGMALSVWLASVCGEGEVLFLIVPACLYKIFGKE